ncbi:MAG TPA: hypothetical protein VJV78_46725, partial [Polyangiales bacterium]|nr:hypothetical protein [Polyangiales bacterium]
SSDDYRSPALRGGSPAKLTKAGTRPALAFARLAAPTGKNRGMRANFGPFRLGLGVAIEAPVEAVSDAAVLDSISSPDATLARALIWARRAPIPGAPSPP